MRSLLIIHALWPFLLQQPPAEPVRFTLDNGLQVILRSVAGARDAAVVLCYPVGGDHDPQGQSGLAHLVEHLWCTSAAGETPARNYEQLLKRYPQGQNFQTGDRYTICAVVCPGKEIAVEIADFAARMGRLRPTQDDLDRELPRIELELNNMYGGIPALGALNLAREAIRPTPLGGRKGGRIADLKQISLDAIQQRLKDHYGPTGVVLAVAGDFDAAEVRKQVEAQFGKLPACKKPPEPPAIEAVKDAKPRDVEARPAVKGLDPAFALAFRAPPPESPQYPAFLVAYGMFFTNRDSMGVEPKLSFFPLQYMALDDPSAIVLKLPVGQDDTAASLQKRLRKWLADLEKLESIDAGKAFASVIFGVQLGIRKLPDSTLAQDPYGVAFGLARRAQLGIDPAELSKRIQAVTLDDVRAVLRDLFAESQGAAVLVKPQQSRP